MKFIVTALFAFVIAALAACIVRTIVLSKDTRVAPTIPHSADAEHRSQDEDHISPTTKPSAPAASDSALSTTAREVVDLQNPTDPVNGKPVADQGVSLELNGYRIHFNAEESRSRFRYTNVTPPQRRTSAARFGSRRSAQALRRSSRTARP